MPDQATDNLLELTTQIVAAHLSHTQLSAENLPSLIQSVYRALSTVGEPEAAPAVTQTSAVPVKKSVFPDFIVCLEDGKKLKMMKRHLQTSYGMSPNDYRRKWGLPRDYPMVAPLRVYAVSTGQADRPGPQAGRDPSCASRANGDADARAARPRLERVGQVLVGAQSCSGSDRR